MRKTKYTVKYTTGFKKNYKRAIKRGLKIELLEQVVALLAMGDRCWKRTAITICPAIGWAIGNATSSRTDCPFTTISRMMCDAGRIRSHSDLFGK